jgi:hypothetical protein
MKNEQQIKALRDLIHSAESSIRSAKKILNSLLGDESDMGFDIDNSDLSSYQSGDEKIIE